MEISHLKDATGDLSVLMVQFSFKVENLFTLFPKKFFLDVRNLSEMAGVDYSATKDPQSFTTRFSPFPFKVITGKSTITFPTDLEELSRAFNVSIAAEDFVIRQVNYDFNDYLERSEMLIVLQENGEGKLTVRVHSFAVLKETTLRAKNLRLIKYGMESKVKTQLKKTYTLFNYFQK